MICPANTIQSTETIASSTTTMVSRFDAYSLPRLSPSCFFTERYTGRNAVMSMPPMTSS